MGLPVKNVDPHFLGSLGNQIQPLPPQRDSPRVSCGPEQPEPEPEQLAVPDVFFSGRRSYATSSTTFLSVSVDLMMLLFRREAGPFPVTRWERYLFFSNI